MSKTRAILESDSRIKLMHVESSSFDFTAKDPAPNTSCVFYVAPANDLSVIEVEQLMDSIKDEFGIDWRGGPGNIQMGIAYTMYAWEYVGQVKINYEFSPTLDDVVDSSKLKNGVLEVIEHGEAKRLLLIQIFTNISKARHFLNISETATVANG